MISLIKILVKVLEAKLEKTGIEQLILKNQNYVTEAKQVWNMIDENFRISATVEEKLKSKIEQFNTALLKKFPELSQEDIDNLRQSIAGEINAGKEAVISNSDLIKQLQDSNTSLQNENVSLKDQLSKVQALVTVTQAIDNSQAAVVEDNSTNAAQATA
jgi:hypothetical protein